VLCAVCCMLCAVCCVLCTVQCCVLCCVLCVCCVLCAVCCVLCAVCCVLRAECCVLCAVYCVPVVFSLAILPHLVVVMLLWCWWECRSSKVSAIAAQSLQNRFEIALKSL
jgi:hypothetical protein